MRSELAVLSAFIILNEQGVDVEARSKNSRCAALDFAKWYQMESVDEQHIFRTQIRTWSSSAWGATRCEAFMSRALAAASLRTAESTRDN